MPRFAIAALAALLASVPAPMSYAAEVGPGSMAMAAVRTGTGVEAVAGAWRRRLADLISTALSRNPDLRARALDVEAAHHRVPRAGALEEPQLELGLRDLPIDDPSLSRDNFTMEMIGLRQALPARGERAARRLLAQSEATGVAAEHEALVLGVAAAVADAFFALAAVDHKLELARDTRVRLASTAAAATERFRVGQGGQADVLRAHLESTKLDETILGLEAERTAGAARLAAILDRAADTPAPETAPDLRSLDRELTVPAVEDLERMAEERSPEIRAARAALATAGVEVTLAELERRPDWTVSGYYGRRQQFDDLVGVSASLSLPWARRGRLHARRAEEASEQAAARSRVEAVRARLRGSIREAYAELEMQRQKLRLYRDVILPQAEVQLEAASEAYTVGSVDFMTLVSAAVELDRYQQAAVDRAAGIGRAVADLQRASGVPLLPGTPGEGEDHDTQNEAR